MNCERKIPPLAPRKLTAGGAPANSGVPGQEQGDLVIERNHMGERREKCAIVANGPSLKKQKWEFLNKMNLVVGLNKIYIALNKFSLRLDMHVIVNNYVAEQSVVQVFEQLHSKTHKFITSRKKIPYITYVIERLGMKTNSQYFRPGSHRNASTLSELGKIETEKYMREKNVHFFDSA